MLHIWPDIGTFLMTGFEDSLTPGIELGAALPPEFHCKSNFPGAAQLACADGESGHQTGCIIRAADSTIHRGQNTVVTRSGIGYCNGEIFQQLSL